VAEQDLSPTIFVLFGATGDLAKRLVLPAFYALARENLLPESWRMVGNGRGDVSHEQFREHARTVITDFGSDIDEDTWGEFAGRLLFAGGGFSEDDPGSMLDVLAEARSAVGDDAQLVHYFATPTAAFIPFTNALAAHELTEGARAVYEKPFGSSPQRFRELDDAVLKVFDEEQVFRIDHFLGKEATQNLHVLRFANALFDAMWNRKYVAAVQIDVPEVLDVDDRAEFYDATGATLDMLVTHLFQVAAEIAMEPPVSMAPNDLQTAREAVIAAFRPIDPEEVVLGQYDGYLDLPEVADGSSTDTFVAARLWVDTDRWEGVPFLLRTGKQMAVSAQRVSLVLKRPDGPITHIPVNGTVISLSLAGNGELDIDVVTKAPGAEHALGQGTAKLELQDSARSHALPAYSTLIHNVLLGDRSLFTSSEGLEWAWTALTPLLKNRPQPLPYPPKSWGPADADALAEPHGWLLGS
jgi:glucose-6-phosphate 1-dehydrogenase